MIRNNKYICSLIVAVSLAMVGCNKDYLKTEPTSSVPEEEVFVDTDGAMVVLNGVYRSMYNSLTNHGNFGQKSYDLVSDLMGEDMVVHTQGYSWFNTDYNYSGLSNIRSGQRPDRTWFYYYRIIGNLNRILSRLDDLEGEAEDKENIRGMSLALRAHSYYYLVNFFGHGGLQGPGVPIYTEPTEEGKARATIAEVYAQIFQDLEEAETLLDGKTRIHRSHINLATALGIHARAALQYGALDPSFYNVALDMSQRAITSSALSLMDSTQYNASGFNTLTAPEWMWGTEVIVDQSTIFASFYSHMDNRPAAGGYAALGGQKKITKSLYDRIPAGDVRKTLFADVASSSLPIYSQLKFQLRQAGNWASDYLFMRLSEMYLIKAEAEARTGAAAAATQTLQSLVSKRYAAYDATTFVGEALLNEILLQRKIELWGEGFALLDVKRLGRGLNRPAGPGNHGGDNLNGNDGSNFAPNVLTLPANSNKFLFAIPEDEINTNNALTVADQNPVEATPEGEDAGDSDDGSE